MDNYNEYRKLWERFESTALERHLVITSVKPDPNLTLYALNVGLDFQLFAPADPWILVKIIQLGVELFTKDSANFGIKILNLWACEDDIIHPYKSGNRPSYIHWWCEHDADFPKVPLHIWLVEVLISECNSPEQLQAIRDLTSLISELRRMCLLEWPQTDD